MDESDPDYLSNFLDNSVYEGIWQAFYEPPYGRIKWTLTNVNAVIVFAFFTTALVITQAQSWTILRYLTHRIFPRAELPRPPDEAHPDLKLTQGEALYDLVFLLKECWGSFRRVKWPHFDLPRPLWFAVAAGLNTAVFVTMGLAIPYFISEGALAAPIVRSALTEECRASSWVGTNGSGRVTLNLILKTILKVDATFEQCLGTVFDGCDGGYYLREAAIESRRHDSCPFPPELCFDGVRPLEITHHNITAFEVGVNSKYALSISHRVTCSPIRTDPFMLYNKRGDGIWNFITTSNKAYLQEIQNNPNSLKYQLANFAVPLRTHNGPSAAYPDERSGLEVIKKGYGSDMSVLPRIAGQWWPLEHPERMSPVLQPVNGTPGRVFVIVFRAGVVGYTKIMADPFFAAHLSRAQAEGQTGEITDSTIFIPDFEATTMACLEQYRFCRESSGHCTDWDNDPQQAFWLLPEMDDLLEFGELSLLYGRILQNAFLSLYSYLSMRTEWFRMVPLRNPYKVDRTVWPDSADEIWVQEVKNWFRKSILQTILILRTGSMFNLVNFTSHDTFRDHNSFCGRLLFRNSDYTNIDWIGFWVTVSVMALIWVGSMVIEWRVGLRQLAVYLWMHILGAAKTVWRVLTHCARVISRGVWLSWSWSAKFLKKRFTLIFHAAATSAERLELQDQFQRPTSSDNQQDIERFVYIDNPL